MQLRLGAGLLAGLLFLPIHHASAADGIFDEARFGIMAHDVPIGDDRRETGADFNGEVLFVSPSFLSAIWSPRPHLGVSINSAGGNSYAYGGLTWTYNFTDQIFGDLGLGGAIHSGPDNSSTEDHIGLGTRVLFHESVELGYRFMPNWDAGLFIDHISNANLGGHNPGITNLGVSVGYSF